MRDFAKIIRDDEGRQVLFYVAPGCEGEADELHCVVQRDSITMTLKLGFADVAQAYKALDNMTSSTASVLTAQAKTWDPEA